MARFDWRRVLVRDRAPLRPWIIPSIAMVVLSLLVVSTAHLTRWIPGAVTVLRTLAAVVWVSGVAMWIMGPQYERLSFARFIVHSSIFMSITAVSEFVLSGYSVGIGGGLIGIVSMPLSLLFLYFSLPQRHIVDWKHCLPCQYDLTGNTSGVCPECGTEIPAAQRFRLQAVNSSKRTRWPVAAGAKE